MKPNSITLIQSQFVRVVAAFASAGPAFADTISLTPTADSLVAAAQPTNNYGGAGALSVAASGLPQGEFQSLLRFDTAAAIAQFDATYGAGNWTIDSVSLRLTATPPNNPLFNPSAAGQFRAHWMQNDSWAEGTGTPSSPSASGITFATLPTFLSGSDEDLGTLNFPGGTTGTISYLLSIMPLFEADIESGGLIGIRLAPADATVSYLFNSRSVGSAPNRPALLITAIPEPTSAMLLLFSLSVTARLKRSA